ncbi:MAG TPA: carbohydrate-binding module family 20 domain-containing protein [Thermoanaerobaculia bacterium]|nr:carbohydrate-binding module family 20 domain-containing protein [Thermoanaerobaculia bacterium]
MQDKIVPGTVSVLFSCANGTTVTGQDVYVVGAPAQLGGWDTTKALKLGPSSYPTWTGTVAGLASNSPIEWKCIKKQGTSVVWQPGANNVVTTPASGSTTASGSF